MPCLSPPCSAYLTNSSALATSCCALAAVSCCILHTSRLWSCYVLLRLAHITTMVLPCLAATCTYHSYGLAMPCGVLPHRRTTHTTAMVLPCRLFYALLFWLYLWNTVHTLAVSMSVSVPGPVCVPGCLAVGYLGQKQRRWWCVGAQVSA